MSYIKPSVLVYQELANAGGASNATPDLGAVIVGPLFNIVRVDPTSSSSLTSTLGKSSSDVVGDSDVTGLKVNLTGTYPGQLVDTTSIIVYGSDLSIKTFSFSYPDVNSALFNGAASLKSKFIVSSFTSIAPTGATAHALLPDASGAHVKVGDRIIVTYTDPDTTDVVDHSTVVSKVTTDVNGAITEVFIAEPIPDFTAASVVPADVVVYRAYSTLEIPETYTGPVDQFDTTDADDNFIYLITSTGLAAYSSSTYGAPNDYEIVAGSFHVGYKALRQDNYSTIQTINGSADRESLLGEASAENPLGLGVKIALDNTTSSIMAVSLKKSGGSFSTEIEYDWARARELIENQRKAYAITPLTQNEAILAAFKAHVEQMSTPVNASWRVLLCNTEIPEVKYILQANEADPATTGTATRVATTLFLKDLVEDFVAASVTPGDVVVITAALDGVTPVPNALGSWIVDEVTNSHNLKLEAFEALTNVQVPTGTTLTYYIKRNLTRTERAASVAAASETFRSNRVWHIQPDKVKVEGVDGYLPGYYLACGHAGMTAGFPVQQGFTNIAVAGIEDLQNSNFYFTKDELNSMAEAGTCLYVQETQGGLPYCRHALTTDMTVLEYREQLKVKNWDFLSFYFYDKMKGFIGSWNITPDTLSNMKQNMIASAEILVAQKLPKIGAPLLSYKEPTVVQNEFNKDMVDIRMQIETVTPNNYTNIYLII